MVLYTLDGICRNWMAKRDYNTMHWYIPTLIYGAACLRELTLDDIKVVNTKIIPIDPNTSEGELPNDFVSCVECGVSVGQRVRPLVPDETLATTPAYTSTYQQTTYGVPAQAKDSTILLYNYLLPLFWNTVTWNEYGENIGRLYGWQNKGAEDTFTIIRARNVIKINENLGICGGNAILKYVSDGQNPDAATQIPAEAFDTIHAYISWQYKEHRRNFSDAEKERLRQMYFTARDILRARLDDITPEVAIRIFQKNYLAAARH